MSSPELDEARMAVDAAIKNYIAVSRRVQDLDEAYVAAWIVYTEYISTELLENNMSQSTAITPPDQLISTSVGLLELGDKFFNIRRS